MRRSKRKERSSPSLCKLCGTQINSQKQLLAHEASRNHIIMSLRPSSSSSSACLDYQRGKCKSGTNCKRGTHTCDLCDESQHGAVQCELFKAEQEAVLARQAPMKAKQEEALNRVLAQAMASLSLADTSTIEHNDGKCKNEEAEDRNTTLLASYLFDVAGSFDWNGGPSGGNINSAQALQINHVRKRMTFPGHQPPLMREPEPVSQGV